ncbi:SH3 domain-containing protein [Desertihabitans brevis]|uniref:SH3 domain-containing protein n=1 Tax=Desertihabitans brevis TaxID=2268447 RepID=A0A367YW04_9ACTN|nr:SH3 domain-containing protein [Desertihabitans brevis]
MRRRLPQLSAGLASLALVGSVVGAAAQPSADAGLEAVPATTVAPVVHAQPAPDRLRDEQRQVREAAAEKRAAEEAAAEKEAAAATKAEEAKKAEETKVEEAKAEEAKKAEEAAEVAAARDDRASRDAARPGLDPDDLGAEAGQRYASTGLNVRSTPSTTGEVVDVLETGTQVTITDRTSAGFRQIDRDGRAGWVSEEYLTKDEPKTSGSSGGSGSPSGGACSSGSGVESGLQPNAVAVHRAICHQFPSITSYGGVRADSIPGHPEGRAVDAMIPGYSSSSGNALGWEVARYVRAHASELGVTEVIFDQKIWTIQRSGEGWRTMSNRGGDTANHRDHVHVTVR